jgi:polar amino acid transport system substrate-binding protein
VAIAACSNGGGGGGSNLALVQKGSLTACTSGSHEPFAFPKAGGGLQGFDIDLLDQLAKGLKLKLVTTDMPFEGIWRKPGDKACDVAAAAITITDQRKQEALFTQSYLPADQSLLVRKADQTAYSSIDELDGKTIAVQAGSAAENLAKSRAPKRAVIKPYANVADMLPALQGKQVDAIMQDQPTSAYEVKKDSSAVAIAATFKTNDVMAMAVARDAQPIVNALNTQLDTLKRDGAYDRTYETWFGKPTG